MSKETFYFPHDYNARADRKLINVIMKHGMAGIGSYWCIVEMLYEEGGYMPIEYERISFELRIDKNVIQSIITDFDLFKINDEKFYSESVIERLKERCNKSEKARESINKRWSKYERNTNVIHTKVNRNTRKEKKEEEKKEINIPFFVFWDSYDKKRDKKECEQKWNDLTDEERQSAMDYIPAYKSANEQQFRKDPIRFLKKKSWNDEIIKSEIKKGITKTINPYENN